MNKVTKALSILRASRGFINHPVRAVSAKAVLTKELLEKLKKEKTLRPESNAYDSWQTEDAVEYRR